MEMQFLVLINTIDRVKEFSEIVSKYEDAKIKLGNNGFNFVDGKSIMGIFSLDLTQPLILDISIEDKNTGIELYDKLKKYII